ncbi:alpha/beta fold hydrolase [Kribbella sp. NPDC051620]|uniref:alpha/beta fold hydrolase n=1 Tax=Kribbella sp. NPDC051620 TaxID=3364120 RepID=UPI003788155A
MISLVDDLPVYYESFGAGRPIVFLPGWGNANGEGRDVHEPIFASHPGWRRIYLDPPGTGQTPSRPWIKNQDDMLDVLARAVDDIVAADPAPATADPAPATGDPAPATGDPSAAPSFALAGTSAGALHARGIVHRDPTRILGLLLRVPGVIVDRAKRTLPADDPSVWDDDYRAANQRKQALYYDVAEAMADLQFLAAIQTDVAKYSLSIDPRTRLDAPTLIVTGRQDVMTGYADAWGLLEDYPRATYAVLDRADHDLPIDDHGLYQALVDDWLTRMDQKLGQAQPR